MVRWYSPFVLARTARKALASTIFGQYADRRLIHASLDLVDDNTLVDECCGGAKGIVGDSAGPVFVDYVADLGDGFDSTYAIAYLIGQDRIVTDNGTKLRRADCLVMGGDQVYPDASREAYQDRLLKPYNFAFPWRPGEDTDRPPCYLIPGNHDWYDGLTLFLAIFCGRDATHLGNWKVPQRRSYFAVHLKDNWWVWGFDSQLGDDIDAPQNSYFKAVATRMAPGSKVILCASVPTWLIADFKRNTREEKEHYYRGLDHIANIVRDGCRGAKIPLVLSGDLHHYSRYTSEATGTNFITAGGGGAFLHPTHGLPDAIHTVFAMKIQDLQLADTGAGEKAVYPPRKKSRHLALGNLGFFWKNFEFSILLGVVYWLCGLFLMSSAFPATASAPDSGGEFSARVLDLLTAPSFLVVAVIFFLAIGIFYSGKLKSRVALFLLGIPHAVAHIVLILFVTAAGSVLAEMVLAVPLQRLVSFLLLIVLFLLSGFVGSFLFGMYLTIASYCFSGLSNDAFSALRLDSHRHFLRMKIDGERLTVFPVCLDAVPSRTQWEVNLDPKQADPNAPRIEPKEKLVPALIEEPVEIDASAVDALDTTI